MFPIKKPYSDTSPPVEENEKNLLECSQKEDLHTKLHLLKEKIQKHSSHVEKSSSSSDEEIHPTLSDALDIYENRMHILQERDLPSSHISSSSSSSIDTPSILTIIEKRIHHLNSTFQEFHSSSHSNHDHFHYLRDCLTQRRIIQESIQELEKLSPESVNYLQDLLSAQNSLFEDQWKPQLRTFIQKTSEKLQDMHLQIQKQADTIQEEFLFSHESSFSHSLFSDFFSWKVLFGIGLGSLTALAFHQWFKEDQNISGDLLPAQELSTTPHLDPFSHIRNERMISHLDTIREYLQSFVVLPPPPSNTYTIENYDELNQLLDICQMIWF
tara:strand:- start:38 stop:1018 length:981 start_codon:yes stop_codon:yes gene_type:complete